MFWSLKAFWTLLGSWLGFALLQFWESVSGLFQVRCLGPDSCADARSVLDAFLSTCILKTNLQLLFLCFPSVSWGPNPRRCPPVWDAVIQLCSASVMTKCAYLILHDSVSLFPLFSDQTPHLLRNVSFVRDYRKYSVIKTSSHNPSLCLQTQILTEAAVSCHINVGYISNWRLQVQIWWIVHLISVFSITLRLSQLLRHLSISQSEPTSLFVCCCLDGEPLCWWWNRLEQRTDSWGNAGRSPRWKKKNKC